MLGKIIGIEDNTVLVNLNVKLDEIQNIINLYVVLEDKERKIIGEVNDIKNNVAYINLVGEFDNDKLWKYFEGQLNYIESKLKETINGNLFV